MKREVFISVDIEGDGPIPGDYSMLSLGAVVVGSPETYFYRELKPISEKLDLGSTEFVKRHGLDRDVLRVSGADPKTAMQEFVDWLYKACGAGRQPIFVAFNATYDWMFVDWYLMHFVGDNPFGRSGLDIKAYYMGARGISRWEDTKASRLEKCFMSDPNEFPHTHNALDDAREQAEIFTRIKQFAENKAIQK